MAATLLRNPTNKLLSLTTGLQGLQCVKIFLPKKFHFSSHLNKTRSPEVCLSPNKEMLMCWHPEPDHPYEHSSPMIRDNAELESNKSVLKVQYLAEEKLKNRPEGPTINELSALFHTTKHQFYSRLRDNKKIDMIKYKPKDRDGL